MQRRYVVLGDIVNSRDIEDRSAFQDRLSSACDAVNEAHREHLYAEFAILKGVDEIGGVLASIDPVYDVVDRLAASIRPYRIRVAVAAGTIDVGAESDDVAEMDGPAFHDADRLLDRVEDDGLPFGMSVGDDLLDTVVADEINLLLLSKRRWTDRQREIIDAYEQSGTQADVARALDITQPAVSKALDRALWPELRTIGKRLRRVLREYDP